jgi:hypothetical protein
MQLLSKNFVLIFFVVFVYIYWLPGSLIGLHFLCQGAYLVP